MELNREQIIKDLEHWIKNFDGKLLYFKTLSEAIALINKQDEQIFKLENHLKECENGYEGTLFLDRCKLHDAEEKIKKLTEERDIFKTRADNLQAFIRSWDKKEQIGYEPTAARAAAEAEMWQRIALEHKRLTDENEKIGIENFELICELSRIKADTVRKMQERLHARFGTDSNRVYSNYNIHRYIDQIAKEMVEGE